MIAEAASAAANLRKAQKRKDDAENRAAIPLPGMLLERDKPAPLIYH